MDKETQLVELARGAGGTAAFSSLVKLHQGKLRAFLFRLCKDYDQADDIAQDSFLAAHRKLHAFSGKGSFGSWLFKIAYNNFLQQQRSSKRREEVGAEYQQQFELLQDRYESISTAQIDLEKAIALLSTDEAATITLCHSAGFSHGEVAAILDMPLGTVKTHINRGKVRLREMLAPPALEKAS